MKRSLPNTPNVSRNFNCFIPFNLLVEAFKDIAEHHNQDNKLSKTRTLIQAGKPPENCEIGQNVLVSIWS